MSEALTKALRGIEAIDPEQAARLLSAFTAIGDEERREDVIALAEALAETSRRH